MDLDQPTGGGEGGAAGPWGAGGGGGGGDGLPADGFLLHRGAELGTIRKEQLRCRAAERE